MAVKRVIISEPWDFMNPYSNDNSIELVLECRTECFGKDGVVASLVQPFLYKGNFLTTLKLVPRYAENPVDKTYNILCCSNTTGETTCENAIFLFIGELE